MEIGVFKSGQDWRRAGRGASRSRAADPGHPAGSYRVPVWLVASLLEKGDRFQVGFKFVAGGRSEWMEPRSWVVVVGLGRLLLTGVVEVGQKRLHKLLILNE